VVLGRIRRRCCFPWCLFRSSYRFQASDFRKDWFRRMILNYNRQHHRDHSRPEHSRPEHSRPEHSSPWGHNRLSNSPSVEHKERTRRCNSHRNQLPTIRQKAKDSRRWPSRMRPQKDRPSILSQSIASFGIRLAAEHCHKKRLLFRTRLGLRQPSIEVFRDLPAFMYTVPEKNSLIDILIKVTEFTTA